MGSPYSTDPFIAMALMIIISAALAAGDDPDPVFTVKDATIKAFNITSDNRLFCIPSLRSSTGDSSVSYDPMEVNVISWDGNKKIADDVVLSPLAQVPWSDLLIAVEPVGLHRQLDRKMADQIRADIQEAGILRVNVRAKASMVYSSGHRISVFCRKVEVHFGSKSGFKEVACGGDVSRPPPPSGNH